jgi:uncharacterized protein YdcH (DUF465 family)
VEWTKAFNKHNDLIEGIEAKLNAAKSAKKNAITSVASPEEIKDQIAGLESQIKQAGDDNIGLMKQELYQLKLKKLKEDLVIHHGQSDPEWDNMLSPIKAKAPMEDLSQSEEGLNKLMVHGKLKYDEYEKLMKELKAKNTRPPTDEEFLNSAVKGPMSAEEKDFLTSASDEPPKSLKSTPEDIAKLRKLLGYE